MSFASEFKEFAMKGNVVDLAVGVIIGAAFGAIVKSLTDEIIMPLVGYIFGGMENVTATTQADDDILHPAWAEPQANAEGLVGDEIPIGARIVFACDA